MRDTEAMQNRVCALLLEGKSIAAICRLPDMPEPLTVYRWVTKDEFFRSRYMQMRKERLAQLKSRQANRKQTGRP